MILKEFYTHLYRKDQKGHISDHHPAKAFTTNEGFSKNMITYAIGLAEKHAGNMTKAVKLIDKVKKGLSGDPEVKAALQAANESAKKAGSRSTITEGAVDKQLRHLKLLLKRTGATLEIKGSTITINLRTGGVEGAMEFQWPKIVKDTYEGKSVKEVASPLVNTLTHAISDVDELIDAVYSDEADDAFKDPKLSKKLLMAVEKLLKKVR